MTVLDIETMLVTNRGGWLTQVGMSTARTGSNPDLGPSIAAALRALGLASSGFNLAADADLLAVPIPDLFAGVCDLHVLAACMGRWGQVDMTAGTDQQKLSQLFDQVRAEALRVQADLLERYGFGRRRRGVPRMGAMAAGSAWPPAPPPPLSNPPYPQSADPIRRRWFNP